MKKEVTFEVPYGEHRLPVHGWIAIRQTGKQKYAGFVLLRRKRVIVGGPGEGYRPEEVFGAPNMFRSQRLFGELNMDDWPVNQAKDGFDWGGGLEDTFIEELAKVCEEYGEFADNYRTAPESQEVTQKEMEKAAKPTRLIVEREEFGHLLSRELKQDQISSEIAEVEPSGADLRPLSKGPIVYRIPMDGVRWILRLHWREKPDDPWMIVQHPSDCEIEVYLNTAHPFFSPYLEQQWALELVQKVAISMALAEKMALDSFGDDGMRPAAFRVLMNKVLKYAANSEGLADGNNTNRN